MAHNMCGMCRTADPSLTGGVLLLYGAGSAIYCVGLRPLSISGLGSLSLYWAGSPLYCAGLGPLSIKGAGSPFIIWGWVPFSSMGLGPLLLYGAGYPPNQWGRVPLQCSGGRIYCIYLAPWSTRPLSMAHSMCGMCRTADPNLTGGVLLLYGAGSAIYCVGLRPLSISGAGSPFKHWGWVPFSSMRLRPLLFCGTEYHRWWSHGVAILCCVHLCAGGGIYHPACRAV